MKRVAATAIALSLLSASVVMAKEHRDARRDPPHRSSQRVDDRRGENERRWNEPRWHSDRDEHGRARDMRSRGPVYDRPAGYRDYLWGRGQRLPSAYYAQPYWVSNYGDYRLRAPPRRCHWVRVNHDVLLTALATGVVLDVMYDYFG